MSHYASYGFYPQEEAAPEIKSGPDTSVRPQLSSANLQGTIVSEPLVVENRNTYFEHEERIKALERKIEELSTRPRRVREEENESEEEEQEEDEVLDFEVGEHVEGLYRGHRYYQAKIAEKKDNGIYVLDWDDGDQEDRLKTARQLRRISFQVGIDISGQPLSRMKSRFEGFEAPNSNLSNNTIVYVVNTLPEEAIIAAKEGGKVSDDIFKVGDAVRGLYRNNRWYDATIREVTPNGVYILDWDDGDTQDHEKTKNQLRPSFRLLCEYPLLLLSIQKYHKSNDPKPSLSIDLSPMRSETPKFSKVRGLFEGGEDERLHMKVQVLGYKGINLNNRKSLKGAIYHLDLAFQHADNAYYDNEINSYAKPGLKESFDLIEASDKVITLLSRITMSNKRAKCSANIYGFFIRNMLLGGSSFDGQVVPQTQNVLILSFVAVVLTFGMQFSLAWYLWVKLPFNQDLAKSSGGANPTLNHIWNRTDIEGQDKYSICRTQPFVQVICIGLFLFYMLNSTPGIIKNVLIILWSHKFVSKDINGVSRIHYWRTSSFWSGFMFNGTQILEKLKLIKHEHIWLPFAMQVINSKVLQFYQERETFYLPLSKHIFPWSMKLVTEESERRTAGDEGEDENEMKSIKDQDWVKTKGDKDEKVDWRLETDSWRMEFENDEMRDFFRRKLKEINGETFDVEDHDEDEQDKENKAAMLDSMQQGEIDRDQEKFKAQLEVMQSEDKQLKIIRTMDAANFLVALDYCDGESDDEVRRSTTGYHALLRSLAAIFIGVIPEIAATMMILICGCQYILWSGSQVGSNTNGLEEIILATVAITFINDIDDALFEHALPELYKTAHDRDEFDLENWMPAEEPSAMEDLNHKSSFWLPFGRFICWPQVQYKKTEARQDNNENGKFTKADFERCYCAEPFYPHMSREQHSDLNFARQYPFLYARKYKYFFHQHFFEGFIWAYGSLGIHIFVLTGIAIAIVGSIRRAQNCSGSTGFFSSEQWPDTCDDWKLLTNGTCK